MGRDDIKKMTEAIFKELEHFEEKFENAYKILYETREKGRKNVESQKEGRSSTFQREIDTYLKGLDIIFKKEQQKYKDTLKTIGDAIEAAKKVNNKANKETVSTEEIINAINSLIPFIEQVYTESQFIINRIEIPDPSYTLFKQTELKKAGLNFPEKKQFLGKELAEIKPDLNISTKSLGAFKAARGRLGGGVESRLYDLEDRKKKEWLSPSALDRKRQEEDKDTIRKHLTDISPDNLHTIPKNVQEKIQNYIYSRNIARQAAYDKNEPYPETEIEKLIYAKTEMRGEEIVGREKGRLFPNLEAEGLTNKKLEETASSPAEVKPKVKRKGKTKETIENIIPDAALGVNTSPIEDVIANTAPVVNTPSSGDGGGGKRRRRRITKVGGRKGGSSGGGGTGGSGGGGGTGGGGTGGGSSNINIGEFKGIIDVRLVDITTSAIKQLDDLLVKVLGSSPIGNGGGGGGTGDMAKLADEIRKSRESSENLAKAAGARVQKKEKETAEKKAAKDKETADKKAAKDIETAAKKAEAELKKNNALEDLKLKQEKQNALDAIRADILAEKEKQKGIEAAAKKAEAELKKNNALEDIQLKKEKQNAIDAINKDIAAEKEKQKGIEAAAKEAKRKEKEEKNKLKSDRQSDPFRKRLQTIFKEGEQELSFLYAKVDSFAGWIPGFNDAILSARKKALETLREGYEAFDKKYAESGSAFKGMMASIKAMYSISPFTVIVAGLTTIGVLLGKTIFNAAQKLNTQIKEISAELGTSNRQSYEMFKNAMNAQTQFENLHASLRDVMDAQKGILGDSGILLRTNDKALSAIADNAKNIGLSVESAGAFYENLRMKGAGDTEANNVMTASLELADKRGFSPQSIVDDIAQNAEFASKYFSKINKDSKSAHRNLIETNIQVKNLGLNFQKAAKMTQHLLSFEQSITAEVEASVALGTHVDIGKARELLLQDDVAGAMTEMMNAIPGGYEGFQKQDFAQRQLSANLLGLEVSELERSLYLREKIKLSNSEDLELAMRHDDYLKKIAGTNDELYRTELNKVQAAERYNTSIEKLSVSFRYALAPVLEAVVPVVDLLADAINKLAGVVKSFVGGVTGANERGEKEGKGSAAPTMIKMGLIGAGGLLMANVMGGHVLKLLRGKLGGSIKGKIGEIVGKVRGGVDTLTGTLGTKTNPMYVISLGGGMDGFGGGGGGVGGGGVGGGGVGGGGVGGSGGRFVNGKWRSQAVLDRAESMRNARNARIPRGKVGNLGGLGSLGKLGVALSVITAGLEINDRQQQGQSNTQAVAATGGGIAGSILGMKGGALVGAKLGTMIGSAIAGPIGAIAGAGIGGGIGGFVGGTAGYYAGGAIVDSQFKEGKKDPSYETQPFQYQGMGLSATGSIYGGVNKPKPIGTPVETSMVDMTPTTFKSPSNSLSNISPNYGMTSSIARESVTINRSSKSVAASAMVQNTIKEKEKTDDALVKEAQEQTKLMHEMIKRLNQPSLAFFNEEGRRQTANYVRVKSTP